MRFGPGSGRKGEKVRINNNRVRQQKTPVEEGRGADYLPTDLERRTRHLSINIRAKGRMGQRIMGWTLGSWVRSADNVSCPILFVVGRGECETRSIPHFPQR